MKINELKARRKKLLEDAQAICLAAEKDSRDFSGEERAKVKELVDDAGKLKTQIEGLEGDRALADQVKALFGDAQDHQDTQGPAGGLDLSGANAAGRGKSIGERFVEAAAFKKWLHEMAPQGYISDKTKGFRSPPILYKSLLTGESVTSAGAFVRTDVTGIYEPLGRRPLVLRDVITAGSTESDLVSFVRQTAQVTQATVVGEATATGGESGKKPEGAMTFQNVEMPVKTVAVWIPATRRALSDVGQLRTLIDASLREDLDEHLEDQMVAGNGSATDGEDFVGIENTSGVLEQAWDTNLLTTIRKARTALQVTGRSRPTAMLCHPNDAETLDLLKDDQGRYYFGGPSEGGVQRVWRVPVIECEAVTEGQAIMGDFRKAYLWLRGDDSLSVSDSHSDFFIRNMVAVLAEMRAAFALVRPSAFILVPTSATS